MGDHNAGWKKPKDWEISKVYPCSECEDTFISKTNLDKHFGTHKGKKKIHYFCKRCEKKYTRKENLRVHYSTHHLTEMGDIQNVCPQIEYKIKSAKQSEDSDEEPSTSSSPSGRKRKRPETATVDRPAKESRKNEEKQVMWSGEPEDEMCLFAAPSGGKGMGTEAKGEPQKEAEEEQTWKTDMEAMTDDYLSNISAFISPFDSEELQRGIVSGGKPQGMMSMPYDVPDESSDGEETDLNDNAPISVNLGRALKGSYLRYQEGDLQKRTFPPATDIQHGQAKMSSLEEPLRASSVCRVSSGNSGCRQAIPIDTAELEVMMAGNVRQVKEVSTRSQFQNGLKVSEEVVERTYDVEFNAGFILK